MPRPLRIRIPGVTFHVVQRGNDRKSTFFSDGDYRAYQDALVQGCHRYDTKLHAYVLMTNHVHLLLTSGRADGISRTMQYVSSRYARYINARRERTGTLWEGRFRSSAVDSERYCLACYRYIELNPVRAGIVSKPENYRWSSYCENVGTRVPRIVEPHASFLALAPNEEVRSRRYKSIVKEQLPETTLHEIRLATRQGKPFGSDVFRDRVQKKPAR